MSAIANTNGSTYVIEYHWGNDLSGSRGGAAGVGGLLYISITHSSTRQIYVPWYDNNGNIMGYWDERGMVASSFDYSAFGETTAYGNNPDAFPIRFSTKYHDTESDLYYYTKRFYHPYLHRWLTRDLMEEEGGCNLYSSCGNNMVNLFDALGLWSSTSESRCDIRRVYKKGNKDTIESLAKEIGMDASTFSRWGRIENGPKISDANDGRSAPKTDAELKGVCYISVPNIWVEADCLRGGGVYDRCIVNLGGSIGSFFGQTLGRWGYHTLKPKTPTELLKTVQNNVKNLYGMTVYAHGSTNGYIVDPSRTNSIHQLSLIRTIRGNGYRIAKANMMQCYSINPKGTVPTSLGTVREFNYKQAWENSAVKVYGYEGVNAIGIDFK